MFPHRNRERIFGLNAGHSGDPARFQDAVPAKAAARNPLEVGRFRPVVCCVACWASMCKQIEKISSGARVIGFLFLAGIQAAEAKQCSPEMPSNPPLHWSYRLIDGRKCWYEGENNFPKALLQWPEQTPFLSAFDKIEPPKAAAVPQAAPQPDRASFEARWQALDMTESRN